MAFIPNPDHLPEINHKDENKENNSAENLEWCDHTYNIRYGNTRKKISEARKDNSVHPIAQRDISGRTLAIYRNAAVAMEITGIDSSAILKVCLGRNKYVTAGSYLWDFYRADSDALF